MAANPNWTRWIHASVASYLKDVATTNSIPSLVEGIEPRTEQFSEAEDRIEIRMSGPFTSQVSKDYFRIQVDVNVLAYTTTGESQKNSYQMDINLGYFHEAMDGPIPIFRYGTGPDDDDTLLGCLTPRSGRNDAIRVIHFGEINKDTGLRQGMVDARYEMYLAT